MFLPSNICSQGLIAGVTLAWLGAVALSTEQGPAPACRSLAMVHACLDGAQFGPYTEPGGSPDGPGSPDFSTTQGPDSPLYRDLTMVQACVDGAQFGPFTEPGGSPTRLD